MTKHTIKHFIKKNIVKTEVVQFHEKFKGKKYNVGWDLLGNLTSCETEDKEIIKWLKENGLDEV